MCILGFWGVYIRFKKSMNFIIIILKNKCGNNSRLSFTDADSLICEIKTENVHENFSKSNKMFEFSNYSTNSKYYDDSNKLDVGKMKNKPAGAAKN